MEIHEGYANWLITKASRLMQGDAKKMMKVVNQALESLKRMPRIS